MSLNIAAHETDVQGYIDDILSGKITAGKYEILAVQRHVDDIKRIGDKDFPYHFDKEKAVRPICFIEDLPHTKGEWAARGEKIKLEPVQKFELWCVFGWVKKNGMRRFNIVYDERARKNAKTTTGAGIANYCLHADDPHEEGAENYFVATKRDQARIAYDEAERQNLRHKHLSKRIKAYKQSHTIVIPGTAAKMMPLGKDSDTEDGLNPHFSLIDEYHAHKTSELLDVIQSGMGARQQPLIWIITTAGFDRNRPCYQDERSLVIQILEGTLEPRPENIFGMIFTLDENDDWTDPKVWRKANPLLGVSVKREYIADQVTQALASPLKRNNVLTKNFNIWTQAETRWIDPTRWAACGEYLIDPEILIGRVCYGGLDLSTTTDLSAWVLAFPSSREGEPMQKLYRFFLPEENILERQRRDKVPYIEWSDSGLITLTPGDVIDYDYIEAQIREDAEKFDLQELAYDPYNATEIINHLQEDGIECVPFRQGFISMSPASKDYEKKILRKEFAHGSNPVMAWMISCTEVKSDPAGNIKPVKPDRQKTGKRIDGVVADIMASWRATIAENDISAYEDGEVVAI